MCKVWCVNVSNKHDVDGLKTRKERRVLFLLSRPTRKQKYRISSSIRVYRHSVSLATFLINIRHVFTVKYPTIDRRYYIVSVGVDESADDYRMWRAHSLLESLFGYTRNIIVHRMYTSTVQTHQAV